MLGINEVQWRGVGAVGSEFGPEQTHSNPLAEGGAEAARVGVLAAILFLSMHLQLIFLTIPTQP